ncbi:MAG: hypothetical protein K2Y23_06730 [Cyanobacteria bacterium]|nr:hypothetical protein [Cyanobacteriota bacterium]
MKRLAAIVHRLMLSGTLFAMTPPLAVLPPVSTDEQQALARLFAPTFIFHPDEKYFPVSPLYPASLTTAMTLAADDRSLIEQMGNPRQRLAAYEQLTMGEKLAAATVLYRVAPINHGDHQDVVVEYWCHYVFNRYRVEGGVLPVAVQANHQQDLEVVYVRLEPRPGAAPGATEEALRRRFTIRSIVTSAHSGVVPANRYDVGPGDTLDLPVHVLVELGSHAMAPDINRDGRFSPEIDSSQRTKMIWGIRDQGSTWLRAKSGDTGARAPTAPTLALCGNLPPQGGRDAGCVPYALEPADAIQNWFRMLSVQDGRSLIGSVPMWARWFGDADKHQWLFPVASAGESTLPRLGRRTADAERGFLLGFAGFRGEPTAILGGRYLLPVQSRVWPDLLVEGSLRIDDPSALLQDPSKLGVRGTVETRFPLDAVSTLFFASGWLRESERSQQRLDAIIGLELRFGSFRVRQGYRLNARSWDFAVVALVR